MASPLIANVYLHYLFDLWADAWRRKVAKGDVIIVRYADDLVMGFQHRAEAERFLEEFKERLAKFGLELHPDKTRLIEFGRYAARDRKQRGKGKPETFTFLGFTHYCGQRHKTETFTVWRITAKKRMVAKLKAIKVELQRRMHDRVAKSVHGFRRLCRVTTNTMLFPAISTSCTSSEIAFIGSGEAFWFVAVRPRERSGRNMARSSTDGFQHPASCIPTQTLAFTPPILRKSRMRRRARTDLSGGRPVMGVPTGTVGLGSKAANSLSFQSIQANRVVRTVRLTKSVRQIDHRALLKGRLQFIGEHAFPPNLSHLCDSRLSHSSFSCELIVSSASEIAPEVPGTGVQLAQQIIAESAVRDLQSHTRYGLGKK